ncbi:hypothetical protein HPP92_000252 [Vanilla planifolia]|uniref:Uncharacterized protein n=1 Tax=Vanilla planifolia TaxID=51239 RepID=A0A835RX52_VANPL|nr:hypothetical protein HPP92_000252 [Vanilla planifolia]
MKARSLPRSAYTVLRSLSWKKKHRLAVEPAEESRSSLLEGERRRRSRWRSPDGEVPRGFFAVYVGQGLQRFVVPTEFLCPGDERAYGIGSGGIRIPARGGFSDTLRCGRI